MYNVTHTLLGCAWVRRSKCVRMGHTQMREKKVGPFPIPLCDCIYICALYIYVCRREYPRYTCMHADLAMKCMHACMVYCPCMHAYMYSSGFLYTPIIITSAIKMELHAHLLMCMHKEKIAGVCQHWMYSTGSNGIQSLQILNICQNAACMHASVLIPALL